MASKSQLLLTRTELANLIGVSDRVLNRMIQSGDIPSPLKLGGRKFWIAKEIDAFVQSLENRKESK